jgi:hypothetical protein
MNLRDLDFEDEESERHAGKKTRFQEFDCPSCGAHNPVGDGFGDRDELWCCYCEQGLEARVSDEGVFTLRET